MIYIQHEKEEMWINLITISHVNMRLDSIKFIPGYYELDASENISERYGNEKPHSKVDISPSIWVNKDKPTKLDVTIFPDSWNPWGLHDFNFKIFSSEGLMITSKKSRGYEINVSYILSNVFYKPCFH